MKRLPAALFTAAVLSLALAACSPVSTGPNPLGLNNKAQPQSVDCRGNDITLNEPGVHYLVSGNCASVTIEGQSIEASIEKTESLAIRGDDNEVDAIDAESVLINGQGNDVEISGSGSVTAVEIAGNGNDVSATATIEAVVINGNSNDVESDSSIGTASINGTGNTPE